MKKLFRRIEKLEKQLLRDPILLEMPDGSPERILADSNYMLDFMIACLNGIVVPEMELIAQSIGSAEPQSAQMVDMARLVYRAMKGQLHAQS